MKLLVAATACVLVGGVGARLAHADDPAPALPKHDDEKAKPDQTLNPATGNEEEPWKKGVPKAERDAALALFREGNQFLNDAQYPLAVPKYEEALKHWSHPAIHYNLALALLNLNRPVDVYRHLEQAVQYGKAGPLDPAQYQKAIDYMKVIKGQIATIEVTCDKPGAEVQVDGVYKFTAPGKYTDLVAAGKHVFTAEPGKNMHGYTAKVRAPYIDQGSTYRVELKMYTEEELTRYHRRWERVWAPWVVVGAGAVVAGVGGVLALQAQKKFDDFDKGVAACNSDNQTMNGGCAAGEATGKSLADTKKTGQTLRTTSYVMYGVGGAAAALGIALVYLNRRTPYQIRGEELEEEQEGKKQAVAPKVTFAPVVSPELTGLAAVGRF